MVVKKIPNFSFLMLSSQVVLICWKVAHMKIEVYPSLLEANIFFTILHSALIRNLIKLKGTVKLTAQGEWVCLKDSKYILFEILAHRTWKGRTSSCRPSKPDLVIWLARPAGACTALPSPIC